MPSCKREEEVIVYSEKKEDYFRGVVKSFEIRNKLLDPFTRYFSVTQSFLSF